ncbi:MAG TPA: polyphosphate--nucleotide phosphotransferase, partial [Chryseobacterium sp.]|nr:polyphosphate--nucleotide phosphotransferase [Chryseobacterium sp.]
MDLDFSDNYIVNNKFSISDADTEYKGNLSKDDGKKILEDEKVKLRELQEKLYADGSKSLLIVI